MDIIVKDQPDAFWLAFPDGWEKHVGHLMLVGDYQFCAIATDDKINVSEVTTGTKLREYPLTGIAILATATQEGAVEYLKAIARDVAAIIKRSTKFDRELERMKKMSFDTLGPIPSIEDFWEYDSASGHLFCKHCGKNYLTKSHKEDCVVVTD